MAESPTAWWCPTCKAPTKGWNLVHITNGEPCRGRSINLYEIVATGTLTDLAKLLNEAGYDAQKVRLHGPARLMVAAKEPSDG